MTPLRAPALMHRVLDGEATLDERAALDAWLAEDAAARTEFERLRALFAGLAALPQPHPPEGMVHALEQEAAARHASGGARNQLSARRGVLESDPHDLRLPQSTILGRPVRRESKLEVRTMNKLWIGGALAAVAVVLVVQFGLGGGAADKDMSGTIVPADRYRAAQPGDVKVTTPGGTTAAGTATAPAESTGNAAQNSSAQNAAAQNAAAQNAAAQNASATNAAAQNAAATDAAAQNARANASAQNAAAQNAAAQNAAAQNARSTNAAAQNAAAVDAAAQNARANAAAQNAAAQNARSTNAAAQNASQR